MAKADQQKIELRRRAEERLQREGGDAVDKLQHDLQVHQIELEMQNEELRTAQISLTEAFDRYQTLYEFAPVGYCTLNESGIVVECNLTLCQMIGVDRDHLLNYPLARYINPKDLLILRHLMQTSTQVGEEQLRLLHQGRELLVELRLHRLQSGELLLAVTDVTRMMELINELKAKGAALDSSSEGVVITDPDHTIRYINSAFEQITGYTRSQSINQPASMLKSGRHSPQFYREMMVKLESSGYWRGEIINRRASGELYPAWLSISRVNDEMGRVTSYLGICSNISEVRQQQQQAMELVDEITSALDGAHAGHFTLNITERRLDWDPRAMELHGITANQFTDNTDSWMRLIFPTDRISFESSLNHQISEPNNSSIELIYRIVRVSDREMRHIRATGKLMRDQDGRPTIISGIFFDITREISERKRLVEARNHAVESSRAKSNFLATMSHELRTPLNGILGVAELLTGTPLDDEQNHYLELLTDSANNLLKLLNDVLDISQIEEGRIELNKTPFSLAEIVHDLLDRKRQELASDRVTLISFGLDQLPAYLEGDPFRTAQVLQGLIDNALKFTDYGTVAVIADGEKISSGRWNVRLHIIDTGIGIPPAHQEQVFDPFYQVDSSITRQHGGAGLGLSICRRLAWVMGGEIRLHSSPDRGSTFTLTLPLDESIEEQATWQNEHSLFNGRSILTVHDHITYHNHYERSLDDWGAVVTRIEVDHERSLVSEVIRSVEGGDYNALLFHIDSIDPVDLVEMVRQLRAHPVVMKLPLLVCSELIDPMLPSRLRELGAVMIYDHSDRVALQRGIRLALEQG